MQTTKSNEVPVPSTDPINRPPPPYQLTRTIHHSPKSHLVSSLVRIAQNIQVFKTGVSQILFGLIQFVLGLIFNLSLTLWPLAKINFPYWLGGLLFMVVGVMSVVAGKFPRPIWITLNIFLNLAGVVFAFISSWLYIIYITGDLWWSCGRTDSLPVNSTELPYEIYLLETCHMGREMYLTLVRGITYMLISLSGAQIYHATMVIITGLRILWRSEMILKSPDDPEQHRTINRSLTEVTTSVEKPALIFVLPKPTQGEHVKELENAT